MSHLLYKLSIFPIIVRYTTRVICNVPDSNVKNNGQSSGITDCFYTLAWQRKAKTKEYVQGKGFDHSKNFFFARFFLMSNKRNKIH